MDSDSESDGGVAAAAAAAAGPKRRAKSVRASPFAAADENGDAIDGDLSGGVGVKPKKRAAAAWEASGSTRAKRRKEQSGKKSSGNRGSAGKGGKKQGGRRK